MRRDATSAVLLIGGTAGTLVALLRHPTGLLSAGDAFARDARLAVWVHAIVIVMAVILWLGFFGLHRRLGAAPDLATAGLVGYGVGVLCVILAAAVSGFVGTALAGRYLRAGDEATRQLLHEIFHYNGMLNQAFARMSLAASAAAILVWSLALWKTRALGRGVALLGVTVAAATLAGLALGSGHIGVHGILLYAGGQGAWTVWVGVALLRSGSGAAAAQPTP